MGEIVGGEKIRFRRIGENIIAGVDAGMKVRVNKPGRDQAAFGADLLVNRMTVVLTDELDAIAVVNDGAVFDYFMFIAIGSTNKRKQL